jgi:hypothetical protein
MPEKTAARPNRLVANSATLSSEASREWGRFVEQHVEPVEHRLQHARIKVMPSFTDGPSINDMAIAARPNTSDQLAIDDASCAGDVRATTFVTTKFESRDRDTSMTTGGASEASAVAVAAKGMATE